MTASERGVVVDAHLHVPDFLPRLPRRLYRAVLRRTIPAPVSLASAHAAGSDLLVIGAVGDPVVTLFQLRRGWSAVRAQVRRIRAAATRAGLVIATSADGVRTAYAAGRGAVLLGVEGADAIGRNAERLDLLHARGVRVITLVHLRNNRIGTTSLPWHAYMRRLSLPSRRRRGLTPFGERVVERMNALGMLIDVSHADTPTLMRIVATSRHPVIATHSGARAVEDFERNLSDAEISAIASRGGVIGLWPYHYRGEGPAGLDDLMRHARHIADVAGAEHLCIGTDRNGVPGVTAGTGSARDMTIIAAALRRNGFSEAEVNGILGENFLRVLGQVTTPQHGPKSVTGLLG